MRSIYSGLIALFFVHLGPAAQAREHVCQQNVFCFGIHLGMHLTECPREHNYRTFPMPNFLEPKLVDQRTLACRAWVCADAHHSCEDLPHPYLELSLALSGQEKKLPPYYQKLPKYFLSCIDADPMLAGPESKGILPVKASEMDPDDRALVATAESLCSGLMKSKNYGVLTSESLQQLRNTHRTALSEGAPEAPCPKVSALPEERTFRSWISGVMEPIFNME